MKGGVLFVDTADKAARFLWLCDAFDIPLLFLADVPGFMIGKQVERQGIIRAGAKMIMAMSEATVPKICGDHSQGLRGGAVRDVRARLRARRLPGIAVGDHRRDGPEAAVNAVYYNKIQALPEAERAGDRRKAARRVCREVDIHTLASELVIDAMIPPERLREEIAARFRAARGRRDSPPRKRRSVTPV